MLGLEARWDALAQASGARASMHPFWCLAWWEARGRGQPLLISVEDEDGDLVGLAPLYVRRRGSHEVVRFIGHGEFAASSLVVAPGARRTEICRAVWRTVLSKPNRVLDLQSFELGGVGFPELRDDQTFRGSAVLGKTCPVARVDQSFEDFWHSRPRDLQRSVHKAERRLASSAGRPLEVEVITDVEGMHRALPDVRHVLRAAQRTRSRVDVLEGAAGPFTRRLLQRAADDGRLRLFVGRVGQDPVSYQVAFTGGAGLSLEMTGFDPAWARFAPGHLLFREVFRHAVTEQIREVDFQVGSHPYKALWCNGRYDLLDLTGGTRAPAVLAQDLALTPRRVTRALARSLSQDERVRLRSAFSGVQRSLTRVLAPARTSGP